MQTGEVGIEITPILALPSPESKLAAQLDALLRRTCQIARALTGAEQAALKLWVGEDSSQARKYFSLSEKYAAFRDFRVDPRGCGLHGMPIPPGKVVRLTSTRCDLPRSSRLSRRSVPVHDARTATAGHLQQSLHRTGRHAAQHLPAPRGTRDDADAAVRRETGHQSGQGSRSAVRGAARSMTAMDISTRETTFATAPFAIQRAP